jgi:hypothetical protein
MRILEPAEWAVFEDAGRLLYDGAFVFERIAGLETGWFDRNEGSLHPVTREVFRKVRERGSTAEDLYHHLNRMMR